MENSKSSVSGIMVALISFVGIVVLVLATGIMSYISYANLGNRSEQTLKATWGNEQNVLGQYTLKLQEIASVPEMYKNDLKEIVTAEMSGRYGSEGSKANMQWIKEHSQTFDSSMYKKIQQTIEVGRNSFETEQTRMLDQKRVYETNLNNVWSGLWLRLAGYPKVNLDTYKVITAADTVKTFETGVQAPVKLR